MIKIYLSVPMNGKSKAEITAKLDSAKAELVKRFGKEVDVVNPFDKSVEVKDNVVKDFRPIFMLGNSIKKMEGCTHFIF